MTSKGFISPDVSFASKMQQRLKVARGDQPADLVIRNAQWLDVFSGAWNSGDVAIFDGIIVGVKDHYDAKSIYDAQGAYLVPGFIDAHVHIESSMMTPNQFARAVLPKGTTAVIWDPHEIANVRGIDGIRWALDSSEDLPVDFFVMIPSCVPSTDPNAKLETSGAILTAKDLQEFAGNPRVLGLAEMMNWPGLVHGDEEVLAKLKVFQNKLRDGHCPGLSGKQLNAYGVAGIHSCHESTTLVEASEKLAKGIHVLIREGSCAKDADALLPLVNSYSSSVLGYCSDDRNPLDIEESGHLDCIINKALQRNIDPISVFRAASYGVATMYGLKDRGAVVPGCIADLILMRTKADQSDFSQGISIDQVWKRGIEHGACLGHRLDRTSKVSTRLSHQRNIHVKNLKLNPSDFAIPAKKSGTTNARVIGVRPWQIVTDSLIEAVASDSGFMKLSPKSVLNKISVIERHNATGNMATALVKGLGKLSGAIATSINHDCHNVIVTGSSDDSMIEAFEELCKIDGGIVVVSDEGKVAALPLPIGGLMTNAEPEHIAEKLRELKSLARSIGCILDEPFLQISFLALPVIPNLKITDRGLVDGTKFEIVSVEVTTQHG